MTHTILQIHWSINHQVIFLDALIICSKALYNYKENKLRIVALTPDYHDCTCIKKHCYKNVLDDKKVRLLNSYKGENEIPAKKNGLII